MISKEKTELFVGKFVKICLKRGETEIIRSGLLHSVSDDYIELKFYEKLQIYDYSCILWICETHTEVGGR